MQFDIALVAGAALRNREPANAPSTMTSGIDEALSIGSTSTLNLSSWRATASPAGSLGRITAVGDKLHENGVAVRFNIATVQFDTYFTVIPASNAAVDAAALNLARQGFNAMRLMGAEHMLMSGQYGIATFSPEYLDRLAERAGAVDAKGRLRVRLDGTRQEIAERIRSRRETISRELSSLQSSGIIGIKGREVAILKPDRLKQLAS